MPLKGPTNNLSFLDTHPLFNFPLNTKPTPFTINLSSITNNFLSSLYFNQSYLGFKFLIKFLNLLIFEPLLLDIKNMGQYDL